MIESVRFIFSSFMAFGYKVFFIFPSAREDVSYWYYRKPVRGVKE
jgi:hypothetical protein